MVSDHPIGMFGHINMVTKVLAHSVELLARRRLQLFGPLIEDAMRCADRRTQIWGAALWD